LGKDGKEVYRYNQICRRKEDFVLSEGFLKKGCCRILGKDGKEVCCCNQICRGKEDFAPSEGFLKKGCCRILGKQTEFLPPSLK